MNQKKQANRVKKKTCIMLFSIAATLAGYFFLPQSAYALLNRSPDSILFAYPLASPCHPFDASEKNQSASRACKFKAPKSVSKESIKFQIPEAKSGINFTFTGARVGKTYCAVGLLKDSKWSLFVRCNKKLRNGDAALAGGPTATFKEVTQGGYYIIPKSISDQFHPEAGDTIISTALLSNNGSTMGLQVDFALRDSQDKDRNKVQLHLTIGKPAFSSSYRLGFVAQQSVKPSQKPVKSIDQDLNQFFAQMRTSVPMKPTRPKLAGMERLQGPRRYSHARSEANSRILAVIDAN